MKGRSIVATPNPGLMAALLKSGRLSGVVRWKMALTSDVVATEASASGMHGYFLDTTGVKTLEEFFAVTSKQLDLAKLDLANFETVLSSLKATDTGAFIAWSGWQDFVKENAADAKVIADLLDTAANSWPGVVFVIDKAGKFADLTELTSA